MPDIPSRLSVLGEQMAQQVEPVSPGEITSSPAAVRASVGHPGRHRWLAAAAAVLALAGALGLFLWLGSSDSVEVDVTARGPEHGPDFALPSGTDVYGLDAGWHERDPGPLAPRGGAAVVFAEGELFVFGGGRHTDGAAYDPRADRWREIADAPLGDTGWGPDGRQVAAVWTGTEIIGVSLEPLPDFAADGPHPRQAASYRPETDEWQTLPTPPPAVYPEASSVYPERLLWSGREVILIDALAAYSPQDSSWRSLALEPEDLPSLATTTIVVEDTLWFFSRGSPTVGHDLRTGETTRLDPPPDHGVNIIGSQLTALPIGSDIVLADEYGRISRLSLPTGRWHTEATLETRGGICLLSSSQMRSDWSVWNLCEGMWLRSPQGQWQRVDEATGTCCLPDTAFGASVLFSWTSHVVFPDDPPLHHEFRIWVPPVEAP